MGSITNKNLSKLWIRMKAYINSRIEDIDASVDMAIANAGHMEMELLWENAAPSSNFAAQTITISGLYDTLIIVPSYSTNYPEHQTPLILDTKTNEIKGVLAAVWTIITNREVQVVRGTNSMSLTFATGVPCDTGYMKTRNDSSYCIPQVIYGIKGVQ